MINRSLHRAEDGTLKPLSTRMLLPLGIALIPISSGQDRLTKVKNMVQRIRLVLEQRHLEIPLAKGQITSTATGSYKWIKGIGSGKRTQEETAFTLAQPQAAH